jgi:gluconate:H+ symporter, GntP family
MPGTHQPLTLLLYASLAVLGLIVLVARFKLSAFLALILASLAVGLCSGMNLPRIAEAFQEGMGAMLGAVAPVVGLGMILGKLLAVSGGAQVIAGTLTSAFGSSRLSWTMLLVGFIVGIPVFFTVGVVLLVPILYQLVQSTRQPLLALGIPMLAGLSVVHGLLPPHPGPMAAIGVLQADTGKTIFYALVVSIPTVIIAGPVLGRFLAIRMPTNGAQISAPVAQGHVPRSTPGFFLALFTITFPILLMLAAAVAAILLPKSSPVRSGLEMVGSPLVAMLLATLFALYSFGSARGFNRQELLKLSEECLGPAGSILLVVGAGGGFNRVLVASGTGNAIASLAASLELSPLLLGWLVAALIRVATGSATVAITTAAGIVRPLAVTVPGTNLELLVLAMGAGSLILSHVNDGGFWFVKEYLGLTVPQTLRSWTVLETVISVVALGAIHMVNWVCIKVSP